MKQLTICLLLLGFTACKDEKKLPEPTPVVVTWDENGSMNINGDEWVADVLRANNKNGYGGGDSMIHFWMSVQKDPGSPNTYESEIISFSNIKKNKNLQRIDTFIYGQFNDTRASFNTKIDGDQPGEHFNVYTPDSLNNWMQITEEQNNYEEIKGVFSLTLIKTDSGVFKNKYPDTLRIRNGKFTVRVDD